MIKRRLFTCSVIIFFAIISAFAIRATPSTKAVPIASLPPVKAVKTSTFVFEKVNNANDLSFANELLPVNDDVVDRKMRHSLLTHNFSHVQSNMLQQKAEKLFPIIEPILRLYGIPDDFKYVPLVESGLCSGVSSKGAAGLWQFMPGTARTYGLRVNSGTDERLNVRKSTIAACKYIKELYGEFNSWTLAAAAYNNGEIKLQKQINKQNEDNYFRMHLNHETGVYVYNLIAMKEIISKPLKYGYNGRYCCSPKLQLLAYN